MAKGLKEAVAAIQDLVLDEFTSSNPPEVLQAPDQPPENMAAFPFVITYPITAQPSLMANGYTKVLYTLAVEFHLARGILPSQVAVAEGMLPRAMNLFLASTTLSETVDTVESSEGMIRVRFGRLSYGGQREVHIGFRIEVPIKITGQVTVN